MVLRHRVTFTFYLHFAFILTFHFCLVTVVMLFLQIKMLECRIAALHKRELEGRDELSQYRQSTESNKYKLEKKILQLQEEYAQLDGQFKQVCF
jgi:hypothetical protein